jgi:putative transcription factor
VEVVEDYTERVRDARESLGWTQQFLARKLNERESFIKNIESGHMSPSLEVAKRLERLLNITLLEKPSHEEVEPKIEQGAGLTLGDVVDVK